MVSGLAVFVGLVVAYMVAVFLVSRRTEPGGAVDLAGPLMLLRTQVGIRTLDALAVRGRRFWIVAGNVFVVLTVGAGALMLVFLVWQEVLIVQNFQLIAEQPPSIRDAVAIPGVNQFIPIGWGLFALIVALVIHEGGHGILALAQGLRVKSLGLLLFVVPIGAFVEPDERELQGSTLMQKLRMFSAGPGPNIVLGTVCVLLFAQVMMPALAPAHDGVFIQGVTVGLPADDAGIEGGMFVTAINGRPTPTLAAFQVALNSTDPGDPVPFDLWSKSTQGTVTVIPIDRGEYVRERQDEINRERRANGQEPVDLHEPWMDGTPFIGVIPHATDTDAINTLTLPGVLGDPFKTQGVFEGSLLYLSLPFAQLSPFPEYMQAAHTPTGAFAGWGEAFWFTSDGLYWLFWINILLGTFNALPAGPLDGGHMFRHSLHRYWRKRERVPETAVRVAGGDGEPVRYEAALPEYEDAVERVNARVARASKWVGIALLVMILAPFVPGLVVGFL